ncbi:MAG TPA: HTTM domain-containing protein [Kofleriaceae bacterium]|nr:HTTM domain-containing protein [Kofleriaceae bacterium]
MTLAVTPPPTLSRRVADRAARPVDVASLAAFRIVFGLMMFSGIVRFLGTGWIKPMYADPHFFFHYPGFGWVVPWSPAGMYVHYCVLAALALMIAAGAWTRIVTPLFTLGFAYTQLIDVTNYLNHHYLVVLLGALLSVLPAHRAWSVDAWRKPALRLDVVPAWTVWLLRFQVGVVYVFAGLAKAQSDWLVHAQPLNIWLSARTETPWIGHWLDTRWAAYAMSWGGFLFDTTIVLWMSWRRTRPVAFAVLVGFHVVVGYLFNIGMFPFIMITSALIFFPPDWPRRLVAWLPVGASPPPTTTTAVTSPRVVPRWLGALLVLHVVVQVALPLRHFVYPGDVLWNEDGMRFSWQVMIREKHGSVNYVVHFADGRKLEVPPSEYLTSRQEREMSGQPDLIAQLGRRIADDMREAGHGDVVVTVENTVSLNGRDPIPMIDPTVDLAHLRDLGPRWWVTPAPVGPPVHLRPRR